MQDQAAAAPEYDLGHYLRPLRRHWVLLAILTVGGLVLGTAYAAAGHRTYTSTIGISVNAPPQTPGQAVAVNAQGSRTSGLVNLDTEAAIVTSSSVTQVAAASLGPPATANSLKRRISVSVPANTTILKVSCTGKSPAGAQNCATEVAAAYLAARKAALYVPIHAQIVLTKDQIEAANTTLNGISRTLAGIPGGTPHHNYEAAIQATQESTLNNLQNQLNTLQVTVVSAGTIVSSAEPGVSSKTGLLIPPLTGLILGLMIAVGAIFFRERTDQFVRNSDDLLHEGVGVVAELQPRQRRHGRKRRSAEKLARVHFAQRTASVVTVAFNDGSGVLYVAGVSPSQAYDDLADLLASTLASSAHSVEVLRPTTLGSGLVAPGFEPVVTPSVATSIQERVKAGRERVQYLIIAGEPAATDPYAYLLAGFSDATLLVVDPGTTRRDDLSDVVDQIEVTQTRLLGAVIWRKDSKSRRGADATGPTGQPGSPNSQRPTATRPEGLAVDILPASPVDLAR